MSPQRVRVVQDGLRPGWQWSPTWRVSGEAAGILERQTKLSPTVREVIKTDALEILARCRPPQESDGQDTGLVVGYVQSGKTLSFTTVAALAADNGYPITVVLSGTKENLTAQTVERLRKDLALSGSGRPWVLMEARPGASVLSGQLQQLLQSWNTPNVPGYPRKVALIVALKNPARIRTLVSDLSQLQLSGRPCLIIDDEADQAGLNTRPGGQPSPTYDAILSLRAALPHHTYLGYTATPQANILISVLDSLSPRFGWVLDPGSDYVGGRSFFSSPQPLVTVIPAGHLPQPTLGHIVQDDPPDSLLEAMRLFFIGVAAQGWRRGRVEPTEPVRSMLVHPSMKQVDHLRYRNWVERVKARWAVVLGDPETDPEERQDEINRFRQSYKRLARTVAQFFDTEPLPGFGDLLPLLPHAMLSTPPAWEVNSRLAEAAWQQTNWTQSNSHILVGGENLSRGFTVEGLTVTYMPRSPGTKLADTIEQRARFFGYKRTYVGLCRVFLPADVRDIYSEYVDHEYFLMGKLKEISKKSDPTMREWRRAMLLATSMRPTRSSVLPRGLYRHGRVDEWTAHRYPMSLGSPADQDSNRELVDVLVDRLDFVDSRHRHATRDQRHGLCTDLTIRDLIDLLVNFKHPTRDASPFSALEIVLNRAQTSDPRGKVAVYLMSFRAAATPNGGSRLRSTDSDGSINPFQGPDPADGSRYPGDRAIHDDALPTVQIHNLDVYSPGQGALLRGNVPVLAVWLPPGLRKGVLTQV